MSDESEHIGRELEVSSPDKETLPTHGREEQEERTLPVFVHMSADHLDEATLVEVVVNGVSVLDVNAKGVKS